MMTVVVFFPLFHLQILIIKFYTLRKHGEAASLYRLSRQEHTILPVHAHLSYENIRFFSFIHANINISSVPKLSTASSNVEVKKEVGFAFGNS